MSPKPGIYRAAMAHEKKYAPVPNDWMRDPKLSMKAKGLLAYFMTHEIGYVITLGQIERQMNDGKSAVRAAIKELEDNGYLVTQQTHDERGYNAGLAFTLTEPESENPTLENPTLDNPTLENRTAYRENNLTKKTTVKENNLVKYSSNDFDAFWETYPRKVGKKQAQKAYQNALQSASHKEIIAGAERYRDDPNRDPSFTKHPTTWLNGGCWDDEPIPQRLSNAERNQIANALKQQLAAENFLNSFQPKQPEIESDTDWGRTV